MNCLQVYWAETIIQTFVWLKGTLAFVEQMGHGVLTSTFQSMEERSLKAYRTLIKMMFLKGKNKGPVIM